MNTLSLREACSNLPNIIENTIKILISKYTTTGIACKQG
jgi:hypothetical protein